MDNGRDVVARQVLRHPGEVQTLAPNPVDRQLLLTCSKERGQVAQVLLWRLPSEETTGEVDQMEEAEAGAVATPHSGMNREMEQVAAFPVQQLPVSEIAWETSTDTRTVASAHETLIRTWRVDASSVEALDRLELDGSMLGGATKRAASALVWDPHHASHLTFALGGSVRMWDVRAKQDSVSIEDAHPSATLALDFNPNKPYALASGGDDGKLKFWDLRYSSKPVLALNAHSHWVWSMRYHPLYDQLVLSGSSDASVALWRVSSISSLPLVELNDGDLMDERAGGPPVVDTLIRRVEDHEDAVYAARWAAGGDAWLFASVSYDGRLAINHVPSTEKYKILL
uniref:EIPR1-like beta-propeller domain-containing protein n=1 Tax=Hyaloperonospora arabidopsidis (strain Emoy2) TaxID=559515 RepID=M4BAZ8_HYAAE